MVNFGGFFAKLGYFAGFYLSIINFPVRIRETTMGGAGNIIFHSLGRKLSIDDIRHVVKASQELLLAVSVGNAQYCVITGI